MFGTPRSVMALAVAVFGTLAACGSSSSPAASSSAPSSSPPPPVYDTTPPAGSAAPSSGEASKPKACGCALCEPVVSNDACTTDADCAPSVPCHAPACVAKAKAVPRKPDTMCTMIMDCTSADSNSCGCLNGKCALYKK